MLNSVYPYISAAVTDPVPLLTEEDLHSGLIGLMIVEPHTVSASLASLMSQQWVILSAQDREFEGLQQAVDICMEVCQEFDDEPFYNDDIACELFEVIEGFKEEEDDTETLSVTVGAALVKPEIRTCGRTEEEELNLQIVDTIIWQHQIIQVLHIRLAGYLVVVKECSIFCENLNRLYVDKLDADYRSHPLDMDTLADIFAFTPP
ncbi:hypothetical protein FA15DRAFT_709992 [Coprinopsis marcescibilis]|uniref:Uncharacterized protein n=1 Tax=Coprinopsis marcescibilis TaxID=230819 RepID=A0A5C3KEH6_COPMA|nr:hypothetical protein FA15DRAFT_709992 [Coprinopsis marcescibilis]